LQAGGREVLFVQRLIARFAVREVGVPSVLFVAGEAGWRRARTSWLMSPAGMVSRLETRHTSPRGNPGAAEDLKREERK
jgi:hypothetical protein